MTKIEYMQSLIDGPIFGPWPHEGMPESEIIELEQIYNNGAYFPKALREYLFLAGNFCCWVDGGPYDSQKEFQELEHEEILLFKNITRPFFVVDVNAPDAQLIIFLDETLDDPILYQIRKGSNYTDDGNQGARTLKAYIEGGISAYEQGLPVF